jgi:hypothetical protein
MRIEDSVFIRGIAAAAAAKGWLVAEEEVALEAREDLIDDCLTNPEPIWPQWHRRVRDETTRRLHTRIREARKTKRHLQKRYAPAFLAFDAALAAAEFVNRSLTDALRKSDISLKSEPLLGVKDLIGGKDAKHHLLIGMHARMVFVATEISLLLQAGFPEGAAARSRTLYELAVKGLLITFDESSSQTELAERYYAAGLLRKHDAQEAEQYQEVRIKARQLWGESFFARDNNVAGDNWALPAMGKDFKGWVKFKDLEDALKMDKLRHLYIACNKAVHADASRVLENTDLRRTYPFATQAEVDLHSTGWIGQASVYYLELATTCFARCVSNELEEWDCMLHVTDFITNARLANRLFHDGYDRLPK